VSNSIQSSVLYVPSFPCQLLSIGKITGTLNYRVIFDSQQVLFQNLATKKMIGEGSFSKGFIIFRVILKTTSIIKSLLFLCFIKSNFMASTLSSPLRHCPHQINAQLGYKKYFM